MSFVTNRANRTKSWRSRGADVTTVAREANSTGGTAFSLQSYGARGAFGARKSWVAISSRGPCSSRDAGLSWKTWVSFVAFQS